MATTRATQIGQLVSAIVNKKPSEFSNIAKTVWNSHIDKDTEMIKTDLKANMFKHGEYEVDFDKVTGRTETTPEEPKNNTEEKNVMGKFMNGLNKSLEDMYKIDKQRTVGGSDGGQ